MQKDETKLNQCEYCGTIMGSTLFVGVCKDCTETDNQLFYQARNHLHFGQKMLPEELAEKSGVELKHIQRWAQSGRFHKA